MKGVGIALTCGVLCACAASYPRARPGSLGEAEWLSRAGQLTSARWRSAAFLARGQGTAPERRRAMLLILEDPELPLLAAVDPCAPSLPPPAVDLATRWRLFCGRHALRVGAKGRAVTILQGVPHAAAFHLAAMVAVSAKRLQEADSLLARGLGAPGADALGPLLRLQRARLALERGHLDRARRSYRGIPPSSPFFGRARQELAWLELRARRPEEAVAQVAILDSRRRSAFFPERDLLLALALADLCDPRARSIAKRAALRLQELIGKLAVFLRRRGDSRLYYVEALASLAGGSIALPPSLHGALIADPSFARAFALASQIARERGELSSDGDSAPALAAELRARLIGAQTLAGETVQRLLTGALGELRELRHRADALLVELDHRSETEALSNRRATKGRAGPGLKGRQRAWPEYWAIWPARSLWPSEIEELRVDLPSRCSARVSAPLLHPPSTQPRSSP